MNNAKNFLMLRWINNNVVNMVSTIHTGYETATRLRRRPRENPVNKNHIRMVWGELPVIPVSIPRIVDDYNHWMGGVDKADQLIAYYRHNLRCRRNWMPIFFHCLDIIRINAFIIAKSRDPKQVHKSFLVDWVEAINKRADAIEYGNTHQAIAALKTPPSSSTGKRRRSRMSHTNPELPLYRLYGSRQDHVVSIGKVQRNCTYCAFLHDACQGKDWGWNRLTSYQDTSKILYGMFGSPLHRPFQCVSQLEWLIEIVVAIY